MVWDSCLFCLGGVEIVFDVSNLGGELVDFCFLYFGLLVFSTYPFMCLLSVLGIYRLI